MVHTELDVLDQNMVFGMFTKAKYSPCADLLAELLLVFSIANKMKTKIKQKNRNKTRKYENTKEQTYKCKR